MEPHFAGDLAEVVSSDINGELLPTFCYHLFSSVCDEYKYGSKCQVCAGSKNSEPRFRPV